MDLNDGKAAQSRPVKGLDVEDAKLAKILDWLDQEDGKHQELNRQKNPSYRYRRTGLAVSFESQGSVAPPTHVATRTIARNELSFLHFGFVYPGTPCCVQLLTTYDMWHPVDAVVTACQYLEGRIHEVRVRFLREIDLAMFTPLAVRRSVLVVDDEPTSQGLIAFHLERLNATVTVAKDGQEAVDLATQREFDLILMDLDMPVMDGVAAVVELRKQGYQGYVCVVTASSEPDKAQCLAAGFDGHVAKPVTRQALVDLLAGVVNEPLVSSLAGDPAMDPLIDQFVTTLAEKSKAIQEAAHQGNLEHLTRLARSIKGDAGGYGFELITEAAARLEEAAATNEVERLQKHLRALVALCARARPARTH